MHTIIWSFGMTPLFSWKSHKNSRDLCQSWKGSSQGPADRRFRQVQMVCYFSSPALPVCWAGSTVPPSPDTAHLLPVLRHQGSWRWVYCCQQVVIITGRLNPVWKPNRAALRLWMVVLSSSYVRRIHCWDQNEHTWPLVSLQQNEQVLTVSKDGGQGAKTVPRRSTRSLSRVVVDCWHLGKPTLTRLSLLLFEHYFVTFTIEQPVLLAGLHTTPLLLNYNGPP